MIGIKVVPIKSVNTAIKVAKIAAPKGGFVIKPVIGYPKGLPNIVKTKVNLK